MAKEKSGSKQKTKEELYSGKTETSGKGSEVPVSGDKDFVLISYADAVKLQRMNIFGIGRRLKKIVKAHKVKHGMVNLELVEMNKPKSRKQILDELAKKKEAEELKKKEEELARLKMTPEQLKKEQIKKLEAELARVKANTDPKMKDKVEADAKALEEKIAKLKSSK